MGYYGYPRIKKIGGYKDDGVDALSSDIYDDTQIMSFSICKYKYLFLIVI